MRRRVYVTVQCPSVCFIATAEVLLTQPTEPSRRQPGCGSKNGLSCLQPRDVAEHKLKYFALYEPEPITGLWKPSPQRDQKVRGRSSTEDQNFEALARLKYKQLQILLSIRQPRLLLSVAALTSSLPLSICQILSPITPGLNTPFHKSFPP